MQVFIGFGEQGCQLANELRAVTVIVDALRASASLAALLERGVQEVWVVAEVSEAWQLKETMPDALLVGERNSVKVPGFDLSNSPTEIFQSNALHERRAVFTSTTGAKRILACRQATAVLVGSCVNAGMVAKAAKALAQEHQRPIVIAAAGVYGKGVEWAEEDIAAAWVIADHIGFPVVNAPKRPSGELQRVFERSLHGQELLALGLGEDVRWCAQVNVVTTVPQVVAFTETAAQLRPHSNG